MVFLWDHTRTSEQRISRMVLISMSRNMRSTFYLHSSVVVIFERINLLDGGIGTFEAECACGRVRVWGRCDKEVDAGRVGMRHTIDGYSTWSSSSSIVTV